jgi:hypothetical protein
MKVVVPTLSSAARTLLLWVMTALTLFPILAYGTHKREDSNTILVSGSELTIQDSRRQSMYYRVAIQLDPSALWQWKSTALSSLDALFRFLRLYRVLPQDRLRVFSSCSREEMHERSQRYNRHK